MIILNAKEQQLHEEDPFRPKFADTPYKKPRLSTRTTTQAAKDSLHLSRTQVTYCLHKELKRKW
jgi:hypothetical protein